MVTQKSLAPPAGKVNVPGTRGMIRATWYTLCDQSGKDWDLLPSTDECLYNRSMFRLQPEQDRQRPTLERPAPRIAGGQCRRLFKTRFKKIK
jgi:hypothetical protein